MKKRLIEKSGTVGPHGVADEHHDSSRARKVDGTVASEAFMEFDRGASAADVVKKLRIMPDEARHLQAEWAAMTGVVVLTGHVLYKVRAIVESYDEDLGLCELETGEDLLHYFQHAKRSQCAVCPRPAAFCMRCFKFRTVEARDFVAKAEAEVEARRAARRQETDERAMVEAAHDERGRRGENGVGGQAADVTCPESRQTDMRADDNEPGPPSEI